MAGKKKKVQEKRYSCLGFCNVIGANSYARSFAKRKFGKSGMKSISEWEELFKNSGLV